MELINSVYKLLCSFLGAHKALDQEATRRKGCEGEGERRTSVIQLGACG